MNDSSFYLDEEPVHTLGPDYIPPQKSIPPGAAFTEAMKLHPVEPSKPRQARVYSVEELQVQYSEALKALEEAGAAERSWAARYEALEARVSEARSRVVECQAALEVASATLDEAKTLSALRKLKEARVRLSEIEEMAGALLANRPPMLDLRVEQNRVVYLRQKLIAAVSEKYRDTARAVLSDIYAGFSVYQGSANWNGFLAEVFPAPNRKELGQIQAEVLKKYNL